MGDRANIIVEDGDGSRVILYVHNGGWSLPALLHKALVVGEGNGILEDAPYLTRAIFDELSKRISSVGVSSRTMDNERPVLLVETKHQRITIWPSGAYNRWDDCPPSVDRGDKPRGQMTFREYLERTPKDLVREINNCAWRG